MDDKIKPIRPDVKTHDSSIEMVMEDLADFTEKVSSHEYQPRFGVVAFVDQNGRIFTHTLGEMRNYELVGLLQYASHLHCVDGNGK